MGIRCTTEFDKGQFNTAISAVMELVNAASAYINEVPAESRDAALCYKVANDVVAMLAPIIPHWAEELSHEALGKNTPVYHQPWPVQDQTFHLLYILSSLAVFLFLPSLSFLCQILFL